MFLYRTSKSSAKTIILKSDKKMKKRVDKREVFWYYSGAPYGKGAAEREFERARKPHGTLKIKQRERRRGTRKGREFKVLSDEREGQLF
ncbi:MAG: hypothetical protein ACFWUC_01675 [Oscillospiraceae bacterium]|jgi:hypothetical protein